MTEKDSRTIEKTLEIGASPEAVWKALTDAKVDVSIGRLMYDVDEPADVADLAARLAAQSRDDGNKNRRNSDDVLTKLSFEISPVAGSYYPQHTFNALVDLNICKK